MEIKSISSKIFRTAPKNVENNNNQTNPFGVNFKGKMISADVFGSGSKSNLVEKVKSKMLTSALVGSMGDVAAAISTRLNSVLNYGKRIKSNVTDFWNKAKSIEIHFETPNFKELGETLKSKLNNPYNKKNIEKLDVSELRSMFKERLEIMGVA